MGKYIPSFILALVLIAGFIMIPLHAFGHMTFFGSDESFYTFLMIAVGCGILSYLGILLAVRSDYLEVSSI